MIHLFVIGYKRPDLLIQQQRLLTKFLSDPFLLHLVDNSPDEESMRPTVDKLVIEYLRPHNHGPHHHALDLAASVAKERAYDYYMFLDHDIFPRRECEIVSLLDRIGFYGIGQYHAPTNHQYIWPGLFGVSKAWLGDRSLNFDGIRGEHKRDDGDTGSMNWSLFEEEDWHNLHGVLDHGYGFLRAPDSHGLQSFGYEQMGPWLHLSNASHWMKIPEPDERDRLATELIESL